MTVRNLTHSQLWAHILEVPMTAATESWGLNMTDHQSLRVEAPDSGGCHHRLLRSAVTGGKYKELMIRQ